MRLYSLRAGALALIFDLDSTLYTEPEYAAFQEEVLIERLGRELGIGFPAAVARVAELRAAREGSGSGKTSLGNIFAFLGVDIATSVRWREEQIDPRKWLSPNPRLDQSLASLVERYKIGLVTNNPRLVGERSLEALGVRSRFSVVVGLDSAFVSKPGPEPFLLAAKLMNTDPHLCISIGDRFDIDLAPALALGMGGILVSGVQDVYKLADTLLS